MPEMSGMTDDLVGTYEEREFLKARNAIVDTTRAGLRKHHIPILVELDVTEARARFRWFKETTGVSLSFTGWVVKCLGQAVSEHKEMHAMRKGRRNIIAFDDVDVSIAVEKASEDARDQAQTLPMPYVVRGAQRKSVTEIHEEIRAAVSQMEKGSSGLELRPHLTRLQSFFFSLPSFLRDLILWRRLLNDPFFAKRTMGTVTVTSVGMFARGDQAGSSWGIPIGMTPLVVALGPVSTKPAVTKDGVGVREYIGVTILFDHDVVDGAPAARFVSRLGELVGAAFGLEDLGRIQARTTVRI